MNPELALASLTASSFKQFVQHFFPVVSNDKFKGGYLVDAICEHLQALERGQIKRLAVACPVRHGKSLISSVLFPAWVWVRDPSLRILSVSAGERLALRDSQRTRQLIKSPLYQRLFGSVYKIAVEQDAKTFFATDKFGSRVALGSEANCAGQDADLIIADDILDYDKAKSELEREGVKDFWIGTLSQRLAKGNGKDRIALVGHRVHEDDIFNLVYETYGNDGTWTYLVLPSEGPSERRYYNGIGWEDKREDGQLLNPERFGAKEISDAKRELRHKYSCIFQQDPTPENGDRFRVDWFKSYQEDEKYYFLKQKKLPKEQAWRFFTCDTALSVKTDSDYTVVMVWDVIGNDLILVDMLRKRLDGVRLLPTLHEMYKRFNPSAVYMEQEFVGKFLIDQMRAVNLPVKAFRSQGYGDKLTRSVSAEMRMEAGRVWFPESDLLATIQRELLSFPNGSHDDIVDALSQACILLDKYIGKVEPELSEEEIKQKEVEKSRKEFEKVLWSDLPRFGGKRGMLR